MSSKDAHDRVAPAIRGRYTPMDAYKAALANTDFIPQWAHKLIVITKPPGYVPTVCVPIWGYPGCNVHVIGENQ